MRARDFNKKEKCMTKKFCLLTFILFFGFSTGYIYAQDVENGEDKKGKLRLKQVTISATKTERDPLTTPGEVSVLNQDYFRQRQAQSLDDVLRYEPGVESGGGPRGMAEGPNIRGLSGERVLTLLDGMRLTFQSGHKGRLFIDVDQLKKVEVVRGPGSALYGSQSVGGVVAMETKDPSDFLTPDTRYGMRQKFGYQYANDELLSTTTLAARFTNRLSFMTSGTFRAGENVRLGSDLGRLTNSAQDTAANLSKLVWTPTPYDEAEFSIQATRQAAQIPFQANSTPSTQSSIANRVNRQITYRLGYTHDNPANPYLNLRGFVYLTTLDVTESRITNPGQRDDISFDTIGYDLRNSMNFGNPSTHHHVVTFGSEFFRNTQKSEGSRTTLKEFVYDCVRNPLNEKECLLVGGRPTPPKDPDNIPIPHGVPIPPIGVPIGAEGNFPSGEANFFALYLQDEITIMDRITLIPAARWENWENEASGQPGRSLGVLNPKVGAVIQVTDSLFLTANYAHGVRQPTFSELFISGTHFPGSVFRPNPDLKPERSRNLDVGIRADLPNVLSNNDQFVFKGTYFRNEFKNFIDFVSTAGQERICTADGANIPGKFFSRPCFFIDSRERFVRGTFVQEGQDSIQTFRNVPDALIQGWEAEFEWRLLENVTLYGNYSQVHGTNETNERPLNSIPPKRGVLGIDYRYPPWGLTLGGRSQFVGDQERVWISDVPGDFATGTPTGGYALFDVWAIVKPGTALLPELPNSWVQGFQVTAGVDNLTDRNYRRHLAGLPEAGINPKVSVWYSINLP